MKKSPALVFVASLFLASVSAAAQGIPTTLDTAAVPSAASDTLLDEEVGVGVDLASRLPSAMRRGAGPAIPPQWSDIDLLPPEGPSPSSSARKKVAAMASGVTFMDANYGSARVTGPALVAPLSAIALLTVSSKSGSWSDTVVASARAFSPGTAIEYSYVPMPGWVVLGAWAHSRKGSVRLPASGSWRFTDASVIVPDVVPSDDARIMAPGYPSISAPGRYGVRSRPSGARAISSERVERTKPRATRPARKRVRVAKKPAAVGVDTTTVKK